MIIISRLGGALNRSGKPQTLLRGLRRFNDISLGSILFNDETGDLIALNQFVGHAQA